MEKSRALILIAQVENTPALAPILTREGYLAETVSDAASLLSQYEQLSPQLVILDSGFSDNAFALCARLREAGSIPILMMTPDDDEINERAYQAGASEVLMSPARPGILLRRTRRLLEAHEQEEQAQAYLLSWQRAQSDEHAQRLLAEALRNTAAALSSTLDQNEVLERILEQVNVVVPSESANIMLIEAGIAYVARSRGYQNRPDRLPVDTLRMNVQETASLCWMVENNRALLISNTDEYEGWGKFDETDPWLKSYVAAPIRIGNHVIGFLNIDSSIPNTYSAADADHLQVFADQAAIAIRNARLFDRVRNQAAEMERRVLQRTAELDYERSQMRAIIDAMTEGVAYTEYLDGQYDTLYVNQALTQMSGYSSEDWRLHSLNLFRPKGMTDAQFNQRALEIADAMRSRGYWRQDLRMMRQDGSEFDSVVTVTRVDDNSDRESVGLVTVIRDVSQEKALQQQKERFVAYASHELRTPITNLKTRLYLMQRQPQRLDEHMQVLEYVTDRMKRLVEDLLDISRFERGVINLNYKIVVLQDSIRQLVSIQLPEAERKLLSLTCDLPDAPVRVNADSERLAQVITNLLSNAINYTPSGGRIVVRLKQVGDQALVEVEDTGIGISEDHLPHIFQPFYRVVSQVEGS
ncbi:MAG: ATP-binding protein, partial [Chloroflexota bacterium]